MRQSFTLYSKPLHLNMICDHEDNGVARAVCSWRSSVMGMGAKYMVTNDCAWGRESASCFDWLRSELRFCFWLRAAAGALALVGSRSSTSLSLFSLLFLYVVVVWSGEIFEFRKKGTSIHSSDDGHLSLHCC